MGATIVRRCHPLADKPVSHTLTHFDDFPGGKVPTTEWHGRIHLRPPLLCLTQLHKRIFSKDGLVHADHVNRVGRQEGITRVLITNVGRTFEHDQTALVSKATNDVGDANGAVEDAIALASGDVVIVR